MGRPTTNRQVHFTADGDETTPQAPAQIYSADRIIYLSGEVSETLITQIIAGMISLAIHDPTTPIKLIISTYGGSIDEMFALYDTMKYIPCPVHTVGMGKIMSAGVLLLAAGTPGSRMIGENARIMVHPCSGVSAGTFFQVKNDTDEHVRQQLQMEKLIARETKITDQKVKELMRVGYDVYLTPKQALEMGIVDQIIGSDKK
jgi:ATP-dependent Clp protease protease subunit